MCCLFGFYNYRGQSIEKLSVLTNSLAEQAVVRGSDASGIAYNSKGRLIIHKEAKSGDKMTFRHPDSIIAITGHTRHATQGSSKKNYNNHPFYGKCENLKFALSHNGVLLNDAELQRKYNLPKTRTETDSFVAVQLLEREKKLNIKSIKDMAEKVHGSFAFTILDSSDTLWLIRGDSPLSLIHFPAYKLYVYASTDEILYKALVDTTLFDEVKKGNFEEIEINSGNILAINKKGEILKDEFLYEDYSYYGNCNWWDYGFLHSNKKEKSYIDDLKSVAVYYGYSPENIDELLSNGFSPEEVEEYIYYGEVCH